MFSVVAKSPQQSTDYMSEILFYRFPVTPQVFYRSRYSYALVNLKPLVPGHVLVVPLRTSVLRFGDLNPQEAQDYMDSLQLIQGFIIKAFGADALNLAIQDGLEAGQSVPHLHTHIIPRYASDKHDDSIHQQLERTDLEKAYADFFLRKAKFQKSPGFISLPSEDRHPRGMDTMAQEALRLQAQLNIYMEGQKWGSKN